jgi:hypothetical protein
MAKMPHVYMCTGVDTCIRYAAIAKMVAEEHAEDMIGKRRFCSRNRTGTLILNEILE